MILTYKNIHLFFIIGNMKLLAEREREREREREC